MIKIDFSGDIEGAMKILDGKIIRKAMIRSVSRSLDSTQVYAGKLAQEKLRIKQKAIRSAIEVKKPKSSGLLIEGELNAKGGERVPLSGFPTVIKTIRKVPKNYTKKRTERQYQFISVKLWGHDNYTPIPGAFKVKLRGGSRSKPMSQRTGRVHLAILKRVGSKRLGVRQLLSNQPDVAAFLIQNETSIKLYANERMSKEFEANLTYYRKQNGGGKP